MARTYHSGVKVLVYVEVNLHVSMQSLAKEVHVGISTIQRILAKRRYHPFKIEVNVGKETDLHLQHIQISFVIMVS